MTKINLRVLTHLEAANKGVLVGPISVISGGGSDDYVCGRCGTSIATSTTEAKIKMLVNVAFKCNACSAINAI